MVSDEFHPKYGIAIFSKLGLSNITLIHSSSTNNISVSVVKLHDVTFVNVYKPPNVSWPNDVKNVYDHPSVFSGDFNSHAVTGVTIRTI